MFEESGVGLLKKLGASPACRLARGAGGGSGGRAPLRTAAAGAVADTARYIGALWFGHSCLGQDGILRRIVNQIVNPPGIQSGITYGPIGNQIANRPAGCQPAPQLLLLCAGLKKITKCRSNIKVGAEENVGQATRARLAPEQRTNIPSISILTAQYPC